MTEARWQLTIDGFEIDRALYDESGWQIELHSIRRQAACPICRHESRHVHSYYRRRIRDLPVEAQSVELLIRVRRFECRNDECTRKVFCERLSEFAKAYGRRSERLTVWIRAIGLALNGEGGARLARKLGTQISGDTLIRVVRCTPQIEVTAPEVMGVDDWAYRKGQRYGTLILDHERRRPVDLFEGRTALDLANWLRQHPGSQVITRDRSTEYATAITEVSPDVQQVADRWHLLHNMRETVKHVMLRCRSEIESTWKGQSSPEPGQIPASFMPTLQRSEHEQAGSRSSRARRKARFEHVKQLQTHGATISQIARVLDMNRKTARIYFYADVFPERKRNKRNKSAIDPFFAHLQKRFDEGCENAMQLWREIRSQGFTGTYRPVTRWLWLRREAPAFNTPKHRMDEVSEQMKAALQEINDLPSSRQLSWLLVRKPDQLNDTDRTTLNAILNNDVVRRVHDLAQRFGQMVREHEHDVFDDWLSACESSQLSEMTAFAKGLRSDYAAVKAALSTKWSNGPTEGHINRLKMIKRLMFGRAKFDLLRIRVLHPA